MCMVDMADPAEFEFYSARMRKARKVHSCGECHREIQIGEEYEAAAGKSDGTMFADKTCRHCVTARGWLERECGGWLFSLVLEDLREHWYEERNYRTRELAALIRGMEKKWRRRDGRMMVLPTVSERA